MEQTQEPVGEPRFDLQQMLRELAVELAGGGAATPLCPSPSAGCDAGPAPARQAMPEIVPGDGHG